MKPSELFGHEKRRVMGLPGADSENFDVTYV